MAADTVTANSVNAELQKLGLTPVADAPIAVAPAPAEATAKGPRVEIGRGGGSSGGAVYGLGMIGAWVYYFRGVTTVREGVFAFLKGLVWPAFMVYDMLAFLDGAKKPE